MSATTIQQDHNPAALDNDPSTPGITKTKNSDDKEISEGLPRRNKSKPHHWAPLFMPLVVLSGSIGASGSCGTQSLFVSDPQHALSFISTSSQVSSYQIEAFAPVEEAVSLPVATKPKKNRPSFDPFAPLDPNAPAQIEDPYGALDNFFAALQKAEAKKPDGRVGVIQFGDSHTVADFGTSKLRRLLQGRFGDAGRGFVLPGRPFPGYNQRDVFLWSDGTWDVENGFRMGVGAHEPYGIAGFRSIADSSSSVAFVGACRTKEKDCPSGSLVSRFEVFYNVTPRGGSLRLAVDDGLVRETIDTRQNYSGEATIGGYWSTELEEGEHELTLRPSGNGPVELFGVVMERNVPGVVLDALGVGGTQAWHLLHWNWDYIGEHLKRRNPSLVILAFGTNDAASESINRDKIVKIYSETIAKIKDAMPNAAILVVGPIDRGVRDSSDCDRYSKADVITANIPDRCQWKTPNKLLDVISGEREAALLSGVAFFDMFKAMGGSGTMDQWVKQSPSLGQKDHTHLTPKGYEYNANLLYEALMVSYEDYLESAPPL